MARLTLRGGNQVLLEMKRIEKRTNQNSRRAMERGAKTIQKLARDYAPVDYGYLEDAIVVDSGPTQGTRRHTHYVGVDENRLGPGYTLGDFPYHVWTHEVMTYDQLGPGSRAKAATGKRVGPKYLERAFDETKDEIEENVAKAVRDSI